MVLQNPIIYSKDYLAMPTDAMELQREKVWILD